MTAREYIDKSLYLLPPHATVAEAIARCIQFKLPETFIETEKQTLQLLKLGSIMNKDRQEPALPYSEPFDLKINYNLHWSQLLAFYKTMNVEVLPLYNDHFEFQGLVPKNYLFDHVNDLEVFNESGAILQLQCEGINYSASEVTRIAEMNNARVLTLFTYHDTLNNKFVITLKIGTQETRSITSTFERFGYEVVYVFMSQDIHTDLFADRYGSLIRMLDIK